MKIRIFALAKELGLDSKVLIDYADRAGVKVKNSALASISPEEREVIVQQVEQDRTSQAPAVTTKVLDPVREAGGSTSGKVRTIVGEAPIRRRRKKEEPEPSAEVAEAVETEPAQSETEQQETVAPDEQPEEDVAAKLTEAPPEIPVEVAPEEAAPAPPADKETDDPNTAPMRRDDYIPASGSSSIREMKPRGTIYGGTSNRPPAEKKRPALPSVAAAPAYKAPRVKQKETKEQPAQKPDMRLTPDVLAGESPLSAHLKKNAEQKGSKKKSGGRTPIDMKSRVGGEAGKDQAAQRRRPRRSRGFDDRDNYRRSPRRRRQKSNAPIVYSDEAVVEVPITVRSLSEALGRPAKALIGILWAKEQMLTINDSISEDLAMELALEIGVDLEIKRGRDIEEELVAVLEADELEETLAPRPPIVTILGHVDHGKTSLLDKIRAANVADGEAGGITQHIASYQVEHNGQKVTFVDTPGHAAFSEMRSRGANVTDIVVLVVAADDGVMPQTMECISHTKAADVPMIVALNKSDLPDTNPDRVLQDLAGQEVLPTEWGGDTEVIRTSAMTGAGLDDLLETILLTAELQELQTNFDRPAVGVCLESFRDEGRGAIAWLIVQKGTLRIGDVVLCGEAYGRIRAIYNDRDEELTEAGPSTPVKVAGLNMVPEAGDHFYVMDDIEAAREAAEDRQHVGRTEDLADSGKPRTLDDILNAARGGAVQDLPLIIKADSPGSLEALRSEINKFEHPEVRTKIVHDGVGGVNESDISLASAAGAIIIAFHVVAEDRAAALAQTEGVEIRRYNIIYEVTETIKKSLEGLLEPERVQVPTGRALVMQTFHVSRFGTIAGCRILNGTIERSNRMHVIRDQTVLNDYNIASLRREKDDVKEVREGMECGIRLEGFNDVKEGDILEAYREDVRKRTFESS
ncbi:MAG: translation initiation factor IF-2 [Planctomycetaceae bacterium]|nr:translation initiation factor IF-2 [Planctomycetaceae bacterium]MBT6484575.1 translation initiation factor IF-2 [Planctomycetaceae bacterium]MBT6495627.1 translation initiation factor IF-2 [Planctomycetaceae bacterium]